jgi:hypothetical protein
MRWIWLVAVIGACATLTSCDDAGPSAQKTVSVPAACPCHPGTAQGKTTVAQTSAPAKLHHRRHHQRREHEAAHGTAQAAGSNAYASASNTAPDSGMTGVARAGHPHGMADADRMAPQYRIIVRNPHRRNWERHHWANADNRYAGNWNRRYARREFTQSVLAPYNYVSHSRVTYVESAADYENRAGYGPHMRGRAFRDTIAATMTGERLDPWHGYDVYCPEQ